MGYNMLSASITTNGKLHTGAALFWASDVEYDFMLVDEMAVYKLGHDLGMLYNSAVPSLSLLAVILRAKRSTFGGLFSSVTMATHKV